MNLKEKPLLFLLFTGIKMAVGQEPEFSQFYASPVYTNPAMAGTAFCGRQSTGRFSLNYRN